MKYIDGESLAHTLARRGRLSFVAYRCLAGRLPFVADSAVELALRHAQDEPPPMPCHDVSGG